MKNYFGFTRTQQLGVVIWSALLVVFLFVSNIQVADNSSEVLVLDSSDIEYVQLNAQQNQIEKEQAYSESKADLQYSLFNFDPNKIELQDWINLGFSEKQGQAIVNYRIKFGPFKKKEDLKKIYVISAEKYTELEPFIVLENAIVGVSSSEKIDLNKATVEELESLPGIGVAYAERILKYRNSLGGFYEMTQLHEVYNLSEDVYQILIDNTTLNSDAINQIKINSASKNEIDKHPYIDFDLTAAILKERELRKVINLEFLVTKNLITVEEKNRIEPYISFE